MSIILDSKTYLNIHKVNHLIFLDLELHILCIQVHV